LALLPFIDPRKVRSAYKKTDTKSFNDLFITCPYILVDKEERDSARWSTKDVIHVFLSTCIRRVYQRTDELIFPGYRSNDHKDGRAEEDFHADL
jgi:hypothetical protein